MASFTIASCADQFPVGTSVGAYLAKYRRDGSSPSGSAADTATVAAAGTLTFTDLVDDEQYVAYASVGGSHRYRNFGTDRPRTRPVEVVGQASGGQVAVYDENIGRWVARGRSSRSLREFGVTGVPSDIERINDAIAASAAEGFTLLGIPGLSVTVEEAVGTKNFQGVVGATSNNRPYAVEFVAGCDVDFKHMTLQGIEGDDIVLACNENVSVDATGTATSDGTNVLTSVTGTGWAVGQYIGDSPNADKIPANTVITAVGSGTLTLSNNVVAGTGFAINAFRAEDDNVRIQNLIVDGGGTAGTRALPHFWLLGLANGSQVDNVLVRNGSYIGALVAACEDTWFGRLDVHTVRGQGWQFGGNFAQQLRRCTIERVRGWNLSDYGAASQPGNPFFLGGVDVQVGHIYGRNCAGGHKIGPNADGVIIESAKFDGRAITGESENVSLSNADNTGLKIQGSTGIEAGRVSVGTVLSQFCHGPGMLLYYTENLSIGTYNGYRNDNDGDGYDISTEGIDDLQIATAQIESPGRHGIAIGSGMGRYRFGTLSIRDCGRVGAAGAIGMTVASGEGRISDLEVIDNAGLSATPKSVQSTADVFLDVSSYRSNLTNCIDIRYARMRLGNPVLGDGSAPLVGQVTLAAAATTTDISNANVVRQNLGSVWTEPWIVVTPANAAARTLGQPYVTIPVGGTFRLSHGSAAGTEVYNWRILEYNVRAAQLA